jgi:hypothetical protein
MRRTSLVLVLVGLISLAGSVAAFPLPVPTPAPGAVNMLVEGTPPPSSPPSPSVSAPDYSSPGGETPEGSFLAAAIASFAAPEYLEPILPLPDPTQRPPLAGQQPSLSPTPEPTRQPKPKSRPSDRNAPSADATPEPTPRPKPTPDPTPKPKPPAEDNYAGTSRFWYPALNIESRWRWYGCEYGGNPSGLGTGIYRWGCNPKSNIYLMSHAWSSFKALKRGYHSGAMREGQTVWYANQKGNTSKWRVKWIKRVTDDYLDATHSEWATVGSKSPIMTLQTCDGANDQYRIIVRLVPDD